MSFDDRGKALLQKDRLKILAVLMLYLMGGMILKHFIPSLGMPLYRVLHLALAASIIGLMFKLDGWKIEIRSYRHFTPSLFFTFGGLTIILIGTNAWISWLQSVSIEYSNPASIGAVSDEKAVSLISILMSVIIAPIREELVFRLGFLRTLSYMARPWIALTLSATLFSASHLFSSSPAMLVPYFFGGIILGLTYLLLGLPWSILLHFLLNMQPLLNAKGALDFLNGNTAFLVCLGLAVAGMSVFMSTLIKSRKAIFGRPKTFP